MKCVNHPEIDAANVCAKCGKGLCIDCIRELHNRTHCQSCAQEILTQEANAALTLANMKDGRPEINTVGSDKRSLRWGLIFLGALGTIVTGFVLILAAVLITIPLWADSGNNWILSVTDIVIVLICLLFGGFLIGRKAGYRGALHGMLSTLIFGVAIIIWSAVGMSKDGITIFGIVLLIIGLFSPAFGALGGFRGEQIKK